MHSEIGDTYREVGKYDEAVAEYTKALFLRPKYLDIKIKLGDTYRDQGNVEKAIKEYLEAKKISKDFAPLRIKLGVAYYSTGEIAKARAEWDAVLTKDPKNKKAKMYLNLVKDPKE